MVTQADLEARVNRLKERIRKAGEGGDRPLPPEGIRRFRKRLKRTKRKLAERTARAEKQAKSAPSSGATSAAGAVTGEKPAEGKAPEESA
jgi:hypothetical protein